MIVPNKDFDSEKAANRIRNLFTIIGLLFVSTILVQALIEAGYWLKNAEWMNYDWISYLGQDMASEIAATKLEGLNIIIKTILDSWVSLFLAGVGILIVLISEADRK